MKMKRFFALFMAMLMALSFVLGSVRTFAEETQEAVWESDDTAGAYTLPDYELRALPEELISYDSVDQTILQIPCASKNGVYFLNDTALYFYSLSDSTCRMVHQFGEFEDLYSTGDQLYVLYSNNQYMVYDLNKEGEASDKKADISSVLGSYTATAIGVDDSGRIYIAAFGRDEEYRKTDKRLFLLSPEGSLLSDTVVDMEIYRFVGFDKNSGNFFMEAEYEFTYYDIPFSDRALIAGTVTDGKTQIIYADSGIAADESVFVDGHVYLDFLCEFRRYQHQNSAALFDNQYLVAAGNISDYIRIANPADLSEYMRMEREGVETEQENYFQDLSSIGVRAVYLPRNKSILVYENHCVIREYEPQSGKVLSAFTAQHPIFNMLEMDNHLVAIEKDGSSYYMEIVTWDAPETMSVQAEKAQMTVGDTQQLSVDFGRAFESELKWSSSDNRVASVTEDGLVSAWHEGTAEITASLKHGELKTSFLITVSKKDGTKSFQTKTFLSGELTNNASGNNYEKWSFPMYSYLVENEDGTLTRIENAGNDKGILIETYTADGILQNKRILSTELSLFGGFFAGEKYNFFVFGESNPEESDEQEILRVVKYSKKWERIADCRIKSMNTYFPINFGSLRMTEANGILYIHTCHRMYDDGDGLHHQSNLTYQVDEESFDSAQRIMMGYVSHSFNQFIQVDDQYIYRADHGDAYPRGIQICTYTLDEEHRKYEEYEVTFQGKVGDNATGASLGGFELYDGGCMLVGNSVDQSDADTYDTSGQRNVFVMAWDLPDDKKKTVWLTDYKTEQGIYPCTPQLVKLGSNQFLVMWEEYNSSADTVRTKLATVDSDGTLTSGIVTTNLRLSDCRPILTSDGLVRWYVTDGAKAVIYTVDPYDPEAAKAILYGDLNGDGVVAANDALTVLQIVVKLKTADALQKEAADVDGSGSVTAADALQILKKVVRLIDSFPAEKQ